MANKSQFIDMLAERLDGDRRRAAAALDAMIDSVYAAIAKGEQVAITGFGVFERRDRAARTARNPATGASVQVKASRVPAFRPGKEFKSVADGATAVLQERAERTQAAVSKATTAVRDVSESVAATVTDSAPVKAAKKALRRATKDLAKKTAPAKKAAAKKSAPAKKAVKAAAKKAAVKAAPVKKAAAKKAPAKKAPAKRAPAKKAPAKKAPAKKAPAKKAPAKKAAKKAPAKRS